MERHNGRVVHLEYNGPNVDTTLFLVGKGITYDTGGCDVKAGGIMAGMHRDKCGAAAVAGLFKTLSLLKPPGLRVCGALALVRNSIGSNAYVSDEIITSRAGKRIRVGHTDAEGRMVMADLLCEAKEMVIATYFKGWMAFGVRMNRHSVNMDATDSLEFSPYANRRAVYSCLVAHLLT